MNHIVSVIIIVLFVAQIVVSGIFAFVAFRMGGNILRTIKRFVARVVGHGQRITDVAKTAYATNAQQVLATVDEVKGLIQTFQSKEKPVPDLPISYAKLGQAWAFVGTARRLKSRFSGQKSRGGTPPVPVRPAPHPLLRVADRAGLLPPVWTKLGGIMTAVRFAMGLQKAWKSRTAR